MGQASVLGPWIRFACNCDFYYPLFSGHGRLCVAHVHMEQMGKVMQSETYANSKKTKNASCDLTLLPVTLHLKAAHPLFHLSVTSGDILQGNCRDSVLLLTFTSSSSGTYLYSHQQNPPEPISPRLLFLHPKAKWPLLPNPLLLPRGVK